MRPLAALVLLSLLLSGAGSRWDWWDFRTGFVIFRWTLYGGLAAVVVALAGLVLALLARANNTALLSIGTLVWLAAFFVSCSHDDVRRVKADTATGVDLEEPTDAPLLEDLEALDLSPVFDIALPPPEDTIDDDAPPCEGCTGSACNSNDDCNSGYCLEGPVGLECVRTCEASCPQGYACRGVVNPGGDPVFLCLYEHVTFCQPCSAHGDCDREPQATPCEAGPPDRHGDSAWRVDGTPRIARSACTWR